MFCRFEEEAEGKMAPPFSLSLKILQKQALLLPNGAFGIVHHAAYIEVLSQSLEEPHVGPLPFLETEIAGRVQPDQILHRRPQLRYEGSK